MAQLAIVADDLTGAADTSACFAGAGYATVIPLAGTAPAADVIALTTESRDMDAGSAARVTAAAVAGLCAAPDGAPRWIYKKIDSVMRGHPRDELLAAMEATGATRALVAPALPAEGRTTIDGRQHAGGVPLESSPFGGAGVTSDLRVVFVNDRGLPVHHLDLDTIRQRPSSLLAQLDAPAPGIVIADAETDDDLAILASAVRESRLRVVSGAAGFARQLAPILSLPHSRPRPVTVRPGGGPVLVVAGTRHVATRRQLDTLAGTRAPIVSLTQAMIDDPSASLAPVTRVVAKHLERGESIAVTTAGLAPSTRQERSVACRLAEVVASLPTLDRLGGLVLTGGDVAAAVCEALGATATWLGGEIYAGQPWGILDGGALTGLPIATKAGSFGGEGALVTCIQHLRQVSDVT